MKHYKKLSIAEILKNHKWEKAHHPLREKTYATMMLERDYPDHCWWTNQAAQSFRRIVDSFKLRNSDFNKEVWED